MEKVIGAFFLLEFFFGHSFKTQTYDFEAFVKQYFMSYILYRL